MKHYIFSEGIPDASYTFDFEQSLFNTHEHRLLQHPDGWVSFYVLNQKYLKISAAIHFNIQHGIASSPQRAPFGSYEFSETLPPKVLFGFITFAEKQLHKKGVYKILIKNASQILIGNKSGLLYPFLLNSGYEIMEAEVGSVLTVDTTSFEDKIDVWEKRRLRQAVKANLKFVEAELSDFTMLYQFILTCREGKAYLLSMTHDELKEAIDKFPTRFKLFAIYHGEELAAASISIRLKEDVLYNFYSEHSEKLDHLSPVVLLIEGVYRYCQNNAIRFLDLGTSAVDGKPNFGLIDFKLNLGGTPTPKLTFIKDLT